jgi:hypothetical protein
MANILSLVDVNKPDIVVIHGLEAIYNIYGFKKHAIFQLNLSSYLRKRETTAAYLIATSNASDLSSVINMGDIVISITPPYTGRGDYSFRIEVLKSFLGEPKVIYGDYLERCLQ